ncbi:MAG: hypothetical protein ILM98_06295 [Kiritimatiellae bacterium]|nr:hypothetical protein [Kiritimatiellia bacterium]
MGKRARSRNRQNVKIRRLRNCQNVKLACISVPARGFGRSGKEKGATKICQRHGAPRRNPIVADVFGRLRYAERRGSGLGKIVDAYAFAKTNPRGLAVSELFVPDSDNSRNRKATIRGTKRQQFEERKGNNSRNRLAFFQRIRYHFPHENIQAQNLRRTAS